jgi:hypothetical protein
VKKENKEQIVADVSAKLSGRKLRFLLTTAVLMLKRPISFAVNCVR